MACAFGFDDVAARAAELARAPYVAPPSRLPADLAALGYDGYRDVRFRPEQALWRREGLPFRVTFFAPGPLHPEPVAMHEVVDGDVRPLRFDPAQFDFGRTGLKPADWPATLGFAGLRLHYPLNAPDRMDELGVFLGASYFRVLGAGQRYGLSARGLALDTVGGADGEEFPRFTAFWLERPARDARRVTLHALLDSPRATGAYRFTFVPGDTTEVQVRARLFLRAPVAMLGLAPLTSMFHHGETSAGTHGDFRPEVHDSDGLLVATGDGAHGDEWLWRPLVNPRAPLATALQARVLRGFGLLQRDRAFASYEDVEARYERRPSAWVVPEGPWPPGRVQLLLLPTPDEVQDNVVATWVPARAPAPGEPLDVAYRIAWQGDLPTRPPNAWTLQSRAGHGPGPRARDELQWVVDFAGPALDGLPADAAVEAVVTPLANARLVESNAYPNEARGGWRMSVRVQRIDPARAVELRAFLRHRGDALTETWTHVIPPD